METDNERSYIEAFTHDHKGHFHRFDYDSSEIDAKLHLRNQPVVHVTYYWDEDVGLVLSVGIENGKQTNILYLGENDLKEVIDESGGEGSDGS